MKSKIRYNVDTERTEKNMGIGTHECRRKIQNFAYYLPMRPEVREKINPNYLNGKIQDNVLAY